MELKHYDYIDYSKVDTVLIVLYGIETELNQSGIDAFKVLIVLYGIETPKFLPKIFANKES